MKKLVQADIIQLVGLIVVSIGCGIEVALRVHIGLIMITAGSICFALGTKLKGR